jgi:hypothetical protein
MDVLNYDRSKQKEKQIKRFYYSGEIYTFANGIFIPFLLE